MCDEPVLHPIPKQPQTGNWDCGIACLFSLLKVMGRIDESEDFAAYVAAIEQRSIWTIDLSYLLLKYDVPSRLYTKVTGANPAHSTLDYYAKCIDEDTRRVNELFERAESAGVDVCEQRLSDEELVRMVREDECVLVVLVDRKFLRCYGELCGKPFGSRDAKQQYIGHYVLVNGFSEDGSRVYYVDPDCRACPQCVMDVRDLNTARTAEGTDEDVLCIPLPPYVLNHGGDTSTVT